MNITNGSGICKTRACGIGQGSSDPFVAIEAAAEAFERELDTGVYTVNSLPRLSSISSETAVQRIETPVQRQIRLFSEVEFYTAVAALNAYFEREQIRPLIKDYPRVAERLQSGPPLSPVEVAGFIDAYQYIPRNLTFQSGILNTKLLTELDNFYNQNISSSVIGSFCSLMPDIFGAIDSFFTALSNIQGFIDKIKDFASSFQAKLQNLQANLQNLLETLKTQLMSVIDKVVDNIKNIIENFTIENIISEVRTFVEDRILARLSVLRESAMRFFEELNIETIKERIKAVIDYASQLFQNPTLDEIQYLIYRFCNLASLVEDTFNGLLDPLRDFRESLQDGLDVISGRSSVNTQRAVAAGAIRLTPEETEARRRSAVAVETAAAERRSAARDAAPSTRPRIPLPGNIRPPTADERRSVTPWNNGEGDGRIGFGRNWIGPRIPNSRNCRERTRPDRLGWERVDIDVRVMIMRVEARFGEKLIINSGYRPEEYNSCLRSLRVGAARNSLHIHGLALDVSWGTFNQETMERFIRIAREEGFRGIGRYTRSGFVHVDIGETREWGS